jgi:hypothetical protein
VKDGSGALYDFAGGKTIKAGANSLTQQQRRNDKQAEGHAKTYKTP